MSGVPVMAQLRIAQMWRGEVMDEKVAPMGAATIGTGPGCTFTTPDVGLGAHYPLFASTEGGIVLNLHHGMRGRVRLGGQTTDVDAVLGPNTRQRSVPLRPSDWGLIELDDENSFFFQLGAPAHPVESGIFGWIAAAAIPLAYALFIHIVALAIIFIFHERREETERKMILARIDKPIDVPKEEKAPPPEELKKTAGADVKNGTDDGEEKAKPVSTAGEEGRAGGKGDRPRMRSDDPVVGRGDPTVAKVMNKGILKHRDKLAQFGERDALDDRLSTALTRLKGPYADGGTGYGTGVGTGVGPGVGTGTLTRSNGTGPGGGGTAHADIVTAGAIKTGGTRPPKGNPTGTGVKEARVAVQTGSPDGDLCNLTPEQIQKVVLSHRGAIQYCFEKELQRVPGLEGKVILTWRIDGSGKVTTSKVKSSTMHNGNVEDCLARQVRSWKFPAPSCGGTALVNYPFIFARR